MDILEELKIDAEKYFAIIRTNELVLNYKYQVINFFEVPINPGAAMVVTIENDWGDHFKYFLQPHEVLFVNNHFCHEKDTLKDIDCQRLFMTLKGFKDDLSPIIKFSINNYEFSSDDEYCDFET